MFDGDTWKYKALEEYAAFKTLLAFSTCENAVAAYINSLGFSATIPDLHPPESESELREQEANDVRQASEHFSRQTLAGLCTCFEVTIRDFFRCTFIEKPVKMRQFIGPDVARGHVDLKKIVDSGSHEALMLELAEVASRTCSRGSYGDMLVRAAKLHGAAAAEELCSNLNRLQRHRNKIVHERHPDGVNLAEMGRAHQTVDSSIDFLCEVGLRSGIPGRYSCVDGSNQLTVQSIAILTSG